MLQSIPWFIGLRYIRSKRKNGYIAFVSLFALLGMTLGVFALIVVLSVMNGFDHELKSRILKVVPHGFITTDRPLRDWQALAERISTADEVVGRSPFIEGKGLLTYGNTVRGIEIQGIEPSLEHSTSDIDQHMLIGALDYLQPKEYGIILGALVARHLGVNTGDRVTLTLPVMSITPAGVFPRSKRFRVVGVFEVGAQVDQTLALMHIIDAQKLFRKPDYVDGLRLKFDDLYQAPSGVQKIVEILGEGHIGKDWSQTQGNLFQAVKMEKTVVGLMLGVIIAIAAFNIVTSLIMLVTEKRSDIAVLRTIGLSRRGVIQIFVVQGTAMGLIGILIGAFSGIFVAHYIPEIVGAFERLLGFQVFDQNVYFVSYLPSVWRLEDTLITCGFAVLVSFFATVYPAYRAAAIEPAEALRYDI